MTPVPVWYSTRNLNIYHASFACPIFGERIMRLTLGAVREERPLVRSNRLLRWGDALNVSGHILEVCSTCDKNTDTCWGCRYFEPLSDSSNYGTCYGNPPITTSQRPTVSFTDRARHLFVEADFLPKE